jgi:uncharacterized SAM-binding protein YcdF (DUF218 family)
MIAPFRNRQAGGIIFRLAFYIFLIAFLFVIYLVRHPLLRLAGGFWIVNESPAPSDAIVILSDDNYNGDRAAEAADIFKAGWAPRVIASGRYLRPYAGIAELEARDLESHGVPESAIVPFSQHASDTREECIAIGQLISSRRWRRILLVTSNYHTRRSEYICERVFPQGTVLRVMAAPDSEYDPRTWWQSRPGMKIFLHELAGFPVAIWETRHQSVQTVSSGLFSSTAAPGNELSFSPTATVYS